MARSPSFGSTRPSSIALFGLAFATPAPRALVRLAWPSNSPDHYAKGTPSSRQRRDSDCCVSGRFQVLFHSPSGVLFTFPSRYWFTIGFRLVFSLGGWSPQLPIGFHVSDGTRESAPFRTPRIWPTGLSPSMVGRSRPFSYSHARNEPPTRGSEQTPQPPSGNACRLDTARIWAVARSLAATWAISVDFSYHGY